MTDNLSTDQKLGVLTVALQERYSATHVIRKRVEDTCLWSLGLLIAATAWLVQSNITLRLVDKAFGILFAITAYIVLRHLYFADLERGFKNQLRTLIRIEAALYLYSPGYFSSDKKPLYPEKWQHAGTEDGDGAFFKNSYLLLKLGIVTFIISVILNGHWKLFP